MNADAVLTLSRLRVGLKSGDAIVDGVDVTLGPGEILGVVGESGSGKTTTALSLFGFTTEGAHIEQIDVSIRGANATSARELIRLRGRKISYVPQNPGTSLNPSMRIGDAIADMLPRGTSASQGEVSRWLGTVGLPIDTEFMSRYPHQLSGGQQQRVCIASALACEPDVVVLDEPTTGLDVVTQARILQALTELRDERGVAMIYVTHDLAVVSQIADRVAVMYAGQLVEEGPTPEVLRRPRHPYTVGLLASIPDHMRPHQLKPMPGVAAHVGHHTAGCRFVDRCPQSVDRCLSEMPALETLGVDRRVRCFRWPETTVDVGDRIDLTSEPSSEAAPVLEAVHLGAEHSSRRQKVVAAHDISFTLRRGQCVALVGESGSGKSTIARAIAGLHPIAAGQLLLDGQPLSGLARQRTVAERRRIQLIFQNSSDALNPRQSVRVAIARPAKMLRAMNSKDADAEVARLLDAVRLPTRVLDRYPGELSGGERQRVAIARALAAGPEVLICDEITSALDVSVQAAVLEVLAELRSSFGVALLFISHDLGVIATVADHVLILEKGLIAEQGSTAQLLTAPQHSYTQRLLRSAPSLSVAQSEWDAHLGADHPAMSPEVRH